MYLPIVVVSEQPWRLLLAQLVPETASLVILAQSMILISDNSLHQMLHKRLQANIVGEDCLGSLAYAAVGSATRVCSARV